MGLRYFLYGVRQGNKCRFARHPGRNRQEERYLPAHISKSVKTTRHPGGHVSLTADAIRPSLETTRDNLERKRACLFSCLFPFDCSRRCTYVCIRVYIVVSYHVNTRPHRRVSHVRERLSAVNYMMDASDLT